MVSIRIRPIDKARFRSYGSFEALAHGPATSASTLTYPLPTTIAGVLSSYVYPSVNITKTSIDEMDLYEDFLNYLFFNKLKCNGDWSIRGGFLYITGNNDEKLYVALGNVFKEYETLKKLLSSENGVLDVYLDNLEKIVDGINPGRVLVRIYNDKIDKDRIVLKRIGIGLEKGVKITRTGYIYLASDLYFSAITKEVKGSSSGLYVEVVGLRCEYELSFITRFAGEGYPAEIRIGGEDTIYNQLNDHEQCLVLVQLTPTILSHNVAKKVENYTGLTLTIIYEDLLRGFAETFLAIGDTSLVTDLFKSKITAIHPGYSLAQNRYRNPYTVITGNPLIIAKGSPKEIYRKGVGEYTKYGWGTLLPIPINEKICIRAEKIKQYMKCL